jgi:hypothetical protein
MMAKIPKNATSLRLRHAAVLAIEGVHRPMTAHEIEKWVAKYHPDLWEEISEKCYDYVRIILSLTPEDAIVKYKCRSSFPGADRRACFYGLEDAGYDPTIWIPLRKGRKTPATVPLMTGRPTTPAAPHCDSSIFFPDKLVLPFKDNVTNEMCDRAWFALTTLIPTSMPFWTDFRAAADTLNAKIERGMQPDVILKQLLDEMPTLTHPLVAADAVHILSREAILKMRECGTLSEDTDIDLVRGNMTNLFVA